MYVAGDDNKNECVYINDILKMWKRKWYIIQLKWKTCMQKLC